MGKDTVTIILDESEADYRERFVKGFSLEKHASGMRFYELNLNKSQHIELKVADSSVVFDYPMGINIFMADIPKVNSFNFALGLSKGGKVKHEYARDYIYKVLKRLTDAGWKRYIMQGDARISGKEVIAYRKDTTLYGNPDLDEKYLLTWEEWFDISTYSWSFYYQDKAFMNLTLHREGLDRSIIGSDGYFLSIDIESLENNLRNNVNVLKGEKREDYKSIWLKGEEQAKNNRQKEEKKAIKKGYHIDYGYEDCPKNRGIFDLSKEKEEGVEKVTCTKTGYWQSFLPENSEYKKDKGYVGEITLHEGATVFIDKNKAYDPIHDYLYWRYLGSAEEYALVEGKLIKREAKKKEKVITFCTGDACPKDGYWQLFLEGIEEKKTVRYFKKGEPLTSNSSDPLDLIAQWKYLGNEHS